MFSATVVRRYVEGVECAVVDEADPVIHVHPELWTLIEERREPWPCGGFVLDAAGDVLTFGTDGQGLGVLRYQVTSEWTADGYRVLRRID